MPTALPRWPIAAMFVPFGLWWVLGLAEMAWIPIAGAMAMLLVRRGQVRLPRGSGVLLLFLALMTVSVIGIDAPGRLVGFTFRALQYFAIATAFVYVYNARREIGVTWLLGVLTTFWLWVVAGGFLGLLAPLLSFRTPLGLVLPASIQANELVQEMVMRRTTQWNPGSWVDSGPRPSAPFLYTNGWGSAYSLLLPLVIAYAMRIPHNRKWIGLLVLIPLSAIPAVLTLNRGMFVGLTVAALWVALRLAAAGRARAVLTLGAGAGVGILVGWLLGAADRLSQRLATSSSTEDRANLYAEAITRTLQSPLFGYGAPRPSYSEGAPSVGTQGQVWMVLFSHGYLALAVFLAGLVLLIVGTWRWQIHGAAGLAINAVQVALLVEAFFYGLLPTPLTVALIAAAVVLPRTGVPEAPPDRIKTIRTKTAAPQGIP
ncbi:O-antigen ligase family protein [Demetria terragena]|uniref:O-antigen ligase family protein n=1 Tax=Demetria terragena TaxID=63959 RepID=UPI00036A0A40|nr:hypothetical protein [Demetria terragena]